MRFLNYVGQAISVFMPTIHTITPKVTATTVDATR